jgi:hypothetical protein
MTEDDWLICSNPWQTLRWLKDTGKASDRKLRLFAVAFCRLEWHLLTDLRSRNAVEVAERYADGLATEKERKEAAAQASEASREAAATIKAASASLPARIAYASTAAWFTIYYSASSAALTTCDADAREWYAGFNIEMPHPKLLREIFGNPFSSISLESSWLTPAVAREAGTIYEKNQFDRLPILADALMKADCDNADILDHLRSQGPHFRGCWAIDLVLGKS